MHTNTTAKTRFARLTSVAAIALVSFWLSCPATHAQQPTATINPLPRYVVGPPNSHTLNKGLCFRELFEKPEQWKETRALTDALLYADWAFRDFTDTELTAWFAQMHQWNIKLELEVGGVKAWGVTGEGTFRRQKPMWDRLQHLGGTIYSAAMDEPLCCVTEAMHKPVEYAVEETANFIAFARANYPNMLIGDVEPYPSISLADQIRWIEALQKRLAARNVRGLDFYRLDVNWIVYDVANKGSWNEVKKLEHYCQTVKLPFSLIYWCAGIDLMKRLKLGDDSTWLTGFMAQGYAYACVGGAPGQFVLESWVNEPSHSVPESGDYTFARSALDFGRKFVKPRK